MGRQRAYKAECNGNDFVIIFKDDSAAKLNEQTIQKLCNIDQGIGADGLLLIDSQADGYDFKIDYYNNDGSWETLCANGALCVIKLLKSKRHHFKHHQFLAGDGDHQLKIEGDILSIRMKTPTFKTKDVEVAGNIGAHVDSGARHFVTLSNIKNINKLYKTAQAIRYDDYFAPTGLNVNFLNIHSSHKIEVITYEKGVEEIMLSCGSGSVAAAFYAFSKDDIRSPLTIINQGGDMELEFNDDWSEVWLRSNPMIEFEINH